MPPHRGSSPPTYNDQDTDHHAVLDASLRSQRKTENAPTNRIKHLMLSKRQEVYKGLMADISQVCDGRSVEMMRGSSDQPSKMVEVDTLLLPFRRSFSDEGDAVKKEIKKSAAVAVGGGPSRINSSWHGGRASLLRDLEETPAQEQKAPCHHSEHKKSEETPTKEQEAPHHSLINNVLRTAESLLQDLEGETTTQEQKAPRQALRSTDDLLNKYRPVRDTKTERKTRNNRASYQKSRRPSVESSEGSMSSLTSLNSGGSNDVIPKTRRRRASDATNTTSSTAELSRSDPSLKKSQSKQSKVTLRKKYKPRHRCPSTNGLVTGIVKPSRYTQGGASQSTACERRYSTASTSTNANSVTDSPGGSSTSINRTFNRRNSAPDSFKPTFSRRNSAALQSVRMSAQLDPYKILEEVTTRLDDAADDGIEGSTPSDEMKDTSTHSLSLSTHSNDNWVPTGVDFSSSMEVYLFEK